MNVGVEKRFVSINASIPLVVIGVFAIMASSNVEEKEFANVS